MTACTRYPSVRRRAVGCAPLVAAVASVAAAIVVAAPAQPVAAEPTAFDRLEGGPGSEAFGSAVTVLTNGNYVVVDPLHDAGGVADVGAVHLYDGATDRRISTLTGSSAQDRVGSKGVAALASGDFVVVSPQWSIGGGAASVGAVTHVDGVRGLDGVVTTANSLHGTNARGPSRRRRRDRADERQLRRRQSAVEHERDAPSGCGDLRQWRRWHHRRGDGREQLARLSD